MSSSPESSSAYEAPISSSDTSSTSESPSADEAPSSSSVSEVCIRDMAAAFFLLMRGRAAPPPPPPRPAGTTTSSLELERRSLILTADLAYLSHTFPIARAVIIARARLFITAGFIACSMHSQIVGTNSIPIVKHGVLLLFAAAAASEWIIIGGAVRGRGTVVCLPSCGTRFPPPAGTTALRPPPPPRAAAPPRSYWSRLCCCLSRVSSLALRRSHSRTTCSILSLYFWVAVKPPRRRPERRTATSRSSSVVSVLVLAAEMPHVRFIMSIYDVWFDVYLTHKKMSKCCGAVFLITFMQTKYGVLQMILGVVARCCGCIFPSLCTYRSRTYPLGEGGHAHDAI